MRASLGVAALLGAIGLAGCGVSRREVEYAAMYWALTPEGANVVCGTSTLGLSEVHVEVKEVETLLEGVPTTGVARAEIYGFGSHGKPCNAEVALDFTMTPRRRRSGGGTTITNGARVGAGAPRAASPDYEGEPVQLGATTTGASDQSFVLDLAERRAVRILSRAARDLGDPATEANVTVHVVRGALGTIVPNNGVFVPPVSGRYALRFQCEPKCQLRFRVTEAR